MSESALRILIDARKLGDSGIGVYIENLVEGLLELEPTAVAKVTLLVRPEHMPSELPAPTKSIEEVRRVTKRWVPQVGFVPEAAGRYSIEEYTQLGKRHRDLMLQHDVFHTPHYTVPFSIPIPIVTTIHDAIHITQPETAYHKVLGRVFIRSALKRSQHVITVSNASLARLTKVSGYSGVPISVVPNGLKRGIGVVPENLAQLFRLERGITNPYYVFVGSDRPHKGFLILAQAFFLLRKTLVEKGEEAPHLIVVGDRFSAQTKWAVRRNAMSDCIHFAGSLNAEELALLYGASEGVIMPSIEEGFGLPALEGMASGKPVICSPEQSLKELCDECAWYAEDFEPESLMDAILASRTNPELRELRIQRGLKLASQYSRERVARLTLDVYRSVVGVSVETDELPAPLEFSVAPTVNLDDEVSITGPSLTGTIEMERELGKPKGSQPIADPNKAQIYKEHLRSAFRS